MEVIALAAPAQALAGILVVVILLWVTEALPLPVTALLGAVACVVLGVAPAKEVFRPFADPLIFLFIGSFMLAEAIRVHGLDRRLAYGLLGTPWVGERPLRILAAVAVVSATISAFISNTATTAMMTAIVSGMLVAIDEATAALPDARRPHPRFATALLLCVAFAASIGGLATPIGTPPNVIGLGFLRSELGVDVSFLQWCLIGVPVTIVLVTAAVGVLAVMHPAGVARLPGVAALVRAERARLGAWTTGQKSTAVAFGTTVALWVIPGVVALAAPRDSRLPALFSARMPEGVAAVVGAILLFLLPGDRRPDGGRPRALEWRDAAGIDWGIVLLYGGGMALGELSFTTGLAAAIGHGLTGWLPPAAGEAGLIAATAAVAVLTSEFTSNTASANMVVPVAISLARASDGNPLVAGLAATFAASLGFMMPVSTPCNAIVYGTGRVPLSAMMRSGLLLDLIGATVVTLAMLAVGRFWPAG
jgi:sodium-dependent dicarboxylate transporter 2/3/5